MGLRADAIFALYFDWVADGPECSVTFTYRNFSAFADCNRFLLPRRVQYPANILVSHVP